MQLRGPYTSNIAKLHNERHYPANIIMDIFLQMKSYWKYSSLVLSIKQVTEGVTTDATTMADDNVTTESPHKGTSESYLHSPLCPLTKNPNSHYLFSRFWIITHPVDNHWRICWNVHCVLFPSNLMWLPWHCTEYPTSCTHEYYMHWILLNQYFMILCLWYNVCSTLCISNVIINVI